MINNENSMCGNKENVCHIVGAGDFFDHAITLQPGDFLIAVDAGYLYLKDKECRIDLVIGDFDSMDVIPDHPGLVKLNKEKDDTDMAAAIKIALEKGYKTVYLYGGTGGRFDHTFANIQCLAYLSHKGARGYLVGKDHILTAVTDGCIEFDEKKRGYISVFSHTDKSEGVNLWGLKYELKDALLSNDFPLGVSNEFTGEKSSVSVKKGTLLIYYSLNDRI